MFPNFLHVTPVSIALIGDELFDNPFIAISYAQVNILTQICDNHMHASTWESNYTDSRPCIDVIKLHIYTWICMVIAQVIRNHTNV